MAAVLDSADLDVSAAQKVLVAVVVPELQFPDANNQKKWGYRKDLYTLLPLYYHVQKDCCPSHSPSMCAHFVLSCRCMQQGTHLWLHSCIPAAPPHQGQEGDMAHGTAAVTPKSAFPFPS